MAEEVWRNVKKFERLWWMQKVGVPPHRTCNRRRMTIMAWVRRFARKAKYKNVHLQTFHTCLHVQNHLADLSEMLQHSATYHKHIRQINIAQSMYPHEKSRFKWETTKVRLLISAMWSSSIWLLSYQLDTWYNPRREAGDVWCYPPVWNLRAVICFPFPISSLVFFCLVVLLFLQCHFSDKRGPFSWLFFQKTQICFVKG